MHRFSPSNSFTARMTKAFSSRISSKESWLYRLL